MSYREQIRRMRRQFHKDIAVLRDQQDLIEGRLDILMVGQEGRFGAIESNLHELRDQVGNLHSQTGKMQMVVTELIDNVDAMAQDSRQARVELRDLNRTLTGRMRLMEKRMGIFMDILETQNDSLEERISRLEQRESPAA